jgi:hypothetical protein
MMRDRNEDGVLDLEDARRHPHGDGSRMIHGMPGGAISPDGAAGTGTRGTPADPAPGQSEANSPSGSEPRPDPAAQQ